MVAVGNIPQAHFAWTIKCAEGEDLPAGRQENLSLEKIYSGSHRQSGGAKKGLE